MVKNMSKKDIWIVDVISPDDDSDFECIYSYFDTKEEAIKCAKEDLCQNGDPDEYDNGDCLIFDCVSIQRVDVDSLRILLQG